MKTFLAQWLLVPLLAVGSRAELSEDRGEGGQKKVGLALCGGIFVAAGGNAALMRALQQQRAAGGTALDRVDYISSISGGSIPTMVYSYATNGASTNELLDCADGDGADDSVGRVLPQDRDPALITAAALDRPLGPGSVQYRMTCSVLLHVLPRYALFLIPDLLTLGFRAAKSYLGWGGWDGTRFLTAVWTRVMWRTLLYPFGIDRNRPFGAADAADEQVKGQGIRITPRPGVRAEAIFCVALVGRVATRGGDFTTGYMVAGDYARKKGYWNEFVTPAQTLEILNAVHNLTFPPFVVDSTTVSTRYALPMTELSPLPHGEASEELRNIAHASRLEEWGVQGEYDGTGGALVEKHLSLELVLAMATQFISFTAMLTTHKVEHVKLANEYSQSRTVEIDADGDGEKGKHSFYFADGGFVEGIGVIPLILKGADHIIASAWIHEHPKQNYHKLYEASKGKDLQTWLSHTEAGGLGEIASYFGFLMDDRRLYNHVFDDGVRRLAELRAAFDTLYLAGEPLVVTLADCRVVENPVWGTEDGGIVDLTIIFYTLPGNFSSQVPAEAVPPPVAGMPKVDERGHFTNVEMREFPNFGGYLEGVANINTGYPLWDLFHVGDLSTRQMNMMNYYASWMVDRAWDGLSVDGVEVFGGFRAIFDDVGHVTQAESGDADGSKTTADNDSGHTEL